MISRFEIDQPPPAGNQNRAAIFRVAQVGSAHARRGYAFAAPCVGRSFRFIEDDGGAPTVTSPIIRIMGDSTSALFVQTRNSTYHVSATTLSAANANAGELR